MLYETLLQSKMLFVMLYFGLTCGILLTIKNLICKMVKQNKVVIILTDILFCVLTSFVFLYAKIKFCYGEFRLFEPLSFCLGIFIEQISINNLVEKFFKLIYNLSVKVFCKVKKTKLGKRIFK